MISTRRTPDPGSAPSVPPLEDLLDRLGELRLCQRVMRLSSGHAASPRPSPRSGAIGEALRTEMRKLFASLVEAAAAHLERGQPRQAEAVLEILARHAPSHPALHLDWNRPAGGPPAAAAVTCVREHLRALPEISQGLEAGGGDNLRAVLGVDLFKAGRRDPALRLLGLVRWECIGEPETFANALSLLYWSGAAAVVERIVAAPGVPLGGEHVRTSWPATEMGVFGALTGHPETAATWLLPQLEGGVTSPSQLFQIFDGLLHAGLDRELGAHFRKPGTVEALWRRLDFEQRERLGAVVYNAGLIEESGRRFESLAREGGPLPPQALPRLVHGLMRTGRTEQAERLIDAARAGGVSGADTSPDSPAALPLAESLLLAGKIEEARTLLDRIPLPRRPGAPLAPGLFLLHERLSQIEAMRALQPALGGGTGRLEHDDLPFFCRMAFYERTLERSYRRFMAELGRDTRHRPVLLAQAQFLFETGRFSELQEVLDDPLLAGNGPIAILRLHLTACLHLGRNALEPARRAYASLASLLGRIRLDIFSRQPPTPVLFEYALLLHSLGETRQALEFAGACVRTYGALGNPCFALEGLFSRESAGLACEADLARRCEDVADALCQPRFFCQGWLYLRAAVILHRLGLHGEATRIVRGKLSRTLFLAPLPRQRLREATSETLPQLADSIQAMFFPNFRGTYWNARIGALLDEIRRPPVSKE